jgi:D-glycero-alpha-D-manno-heptose-7-phosphate kinase
LVRRVEVTAPCRADLAGGTLDIWPLGVLHAGSLTVNAAVPVRVRMSIEESSESERVLLHIGDGPQQPLTPNDALTDLTAAVAFWFRPQGGVTVRVVEQAPIGSGLGGSSAYAVALACGLLELDAQSREDRLLVATLRDLEARILCAPTGTQDYWAALLGGVLSLHLEPGGERVERIKVDREWLGRQLTVFFTGIRHHSGMVNWQIVRRRLDGEPATHNALDEIMWAARQCREGLLACDQARVAEAIRVEWAARRRLAPEVCPPELDLVTTGVMEAGAKAVKACGAGGGGCVLVWHEPENRAAIADALLRLAPAGKVLAVGVESTGCVVLPVGDG